jgi:8-oxo-dGTP pyrophosphatase MutT (NUDIX family)
MISELVDILRPPSFEPTGEIMPVIEAIDAGHWLGVMNLWLVRPNGTILYQQRPQNGWEPGKLDGSVGGYYRAGESGLDGLREAQEELGWCCAEADATLLGRHLSVGVDSRGRERRLAVTVYMATCDVPLSDFVLSKDEVPALYEIPGCAVVSLFARAGTTVLVRGMDCDGRSMERTISSSDFSYVFGGYHVKIAHIALAYAAGQPIVYY